jgi:hypothetical protein
MEVVSELKRCLGAAIDMQVAAIDMQQGIRQLRPTEGVGRLCGKSVAGRDGGGGHALGGDGGAVNAGAYRDIALIGCYAEVELVLLCWYKSACFTGTKVQMLTQKLTRYLRTCLLLVLQERDKHCMGGGFTLWGGGRGSRICF